MAPGMFAPSRCHCRARTGAGTPLHTPAATPSALPILPVPVRTGALTSAGGTMATATVTRNVVCADPPEFVAVTVTPSAARSWTVAMLTTPVAGSMLAPAPVTLKRRFAPVKSCAVGTDWTPLP